MRTSDGFSDTESTTPVPPPSGRSSVTLSFDRVTLPALAARRAPLESKNRPLRASSQTEPLPSSAEFALMRPDWFTASPIIVVLPRAVTISPRLVAVVPPSTSTNSPRRLLPLPSAGANR